jgi:hypothetical protein
MENIGDYARLGYDAIMGHTGYRNLHIQGWCLNIKKWKQQVPPERCYLSIKKYSATFRKTAVSDIYFHSQ